MPKGFVLICAPVRIGRYPHVNGRVIDQVLIAAQFAAALQNDQENVVFRQAVRLARTGAATSVVAGDYSATLPM